MPPRRCLHQNKPEVRIEFPYTASQRPLSSSSSPCLLTSPSSRWRKITYVAYKKLDEIRVAYHLELRESEDQVYDLLL